MAVAYEGHAERLIEQLRTRGASRATAEDILHDAFARAVEQGEFLDEEHCLRWISVVARNLLTDTQRSAATRYAGGRLPMTLVDESLPDPLETLCRQDTDKQVRATLGAMTEREARLLWERDALGKPVAVAAASLGVTTPSASVLLTRARRRFSDGWANARAAIFLPFTRAIRVLRRTTPSLPGAAFSLVGPLVVLGSLGVGGLVSPNLEAPVSTMASAASANATAAGHVRLSPSASAATTDSARPGADERRRVVTLPVANDKAAVTAGDYREDRPLAEARVSHDVAGHQDEAIVTVYDGEEGSDPQGTTACASLHLDEDPEASLDECS